MKKNTGFTLIEILIALIILSFGLLGLAGLQAASMQQNQDSSFRSQATALAYDLADRIRANSSQIAIYLALAPALNNNCLGIAGCTPQQMANHDLAEWNAALNSLPGGGVGSIAQTAANVYTIYVNWDDDKDGSLDNDGDGDVDNDDALFTLGFSL